MCPNLAFNSGPLMGSKCQYQEDHISMNAPYLALYSSPILYLIDVCVCVISGQFRIGCLTYSNQYVVVRLRTDCMCCIVSVSGDAPKWIPRLFCSRVFGLDGIREIGWIILLVLYQFQVRKHTVFCFLHATLSLWLLGLFKQS